MGVGEEADRTKRKEMLVKYIFTQKFNQLLQIPVEKLDLAV